MKMAFSAGRSCPLVAPPVVKTSRRASSARNTSSFGSLSSTLTSAWPCAGTGPASPNPETGEPYALSFPMVTVGDWVRLQALLVDRLEIDRLADRRAHRPGAGRGGDDGRLFDSVLRRQEERHEALLSRRGGNENPYALHQQLGNLMTRVATVVRRNEQLVAAYDEVCTLEERWQRCSLSDTGNWTNQNVVFTKALGDMFPVAMGFGIAPGAKTTGAASAAATRPGSGRATPARVGWRARCRPPSRG